MPIWKEAGGLKGDKGQKGDKGDAGTPYTGPKILVVDSLPSNPEQDTLYFVKES